MRATSNRKLAEALGVSETAVRKALAAGRISREADGGFDVARVKRQWAGNTDAAQQRPAAKAGLRPVPAAALASVRETLRESGDPGGAEPIAAGGPSFLQARTANEVLKAQERKLRLSRLKGELIDRARATAQVFTPFFRARRGRAYGFRFKDWTDYQAFAQGLGVGGGTTKTFQLVKRYASGGVIDTKAIAKPVAGTVKVYRDGVEATAVWSVDTTTGLATFATAPAAGVQVTAEVDVPVRFDRASFTAAIDGRPIDAWTAVNCCDMPTSTASVSVRTTRNGFARSTRAARST
jgi:uncharacterized protein (TIGR02217 family)